MNNNSNNPASQLDANKKMFENFPYMNPQNNPIPNFDMNMFPKQNFLFPLMRNSNDNQNWMNQMLVKNYPKGSEDGDKK